MKISYLFVIALLSQSCILKKLAVSNADIGVESQIEKRLPLYTAQKDKLSLDTDKFLNDSKPNLKAAIPLIQSLELNEEKIDSQFQSIKETYVVISTDYLNLLASYMALMDQKQQKIFFKKFDETTSDYKDRSLSQIQEKIEDRFEMFFGEIHQDQLKLLKSHAKYQQTTQAESLNSRMDLREKLVLVFSQNKTAEEKTPLISQIYLDYQNGLLDNEKTIGLLKAIMPTLKEDQKKFFKMTIKEFEELIEYFLTKKF